MLHVQETRVDHVYNDTAHVYNVGTLGTRLGNTLLSRQGATSPARSPATETYKHLESARWHPASYTSIQLASYEHPTSIFLGALSILRLPRQVANKTSFFACKRIFQRLCFIFRLLQWPECAAWLVGEFRSLLNC